MIVAAKGVQIYQCRVSKSSSDRYEWSFVAPEAELFDTDGIFIGRHYGGPHWAANDGSKILGTVKERAEAPVPGAIPWLLLAANSVGGRGIFSKITSVQRIHTTGGAAPARACTRSIAGVSARIAYTADYYLFRAH